MNTYERLLQVFDAVFEGEISTDNITLTSSLREDVGINSIGMLYMAMALEEEFGVKFTNEDFIRIQTVEDVVQCLESKS